MTLTKLLTDDDIQRLTRGEYIELLPAKPGHRIVFDGKAHIDKGLMVGYHYEPVEPEPTHD